MMTDNERDRHIIALVEGQAEIKAELSAMPTAVSLEITKAMNRHVETSHKNGLDLLGKIRTEVEGAVRSCAFAREHSDDTGGGDRLSIPPRAWAVIAPALAAALYGIGELIRGGLALLAH